MRPVPVTMLLAILAGAATAQLHDPFPAVFELSQLLPENGGDGSLGFVVQGQNAGELLGYAVAGIGDINADGLADFAIGAPRAHVGELLEAGIVYVIYGRHPDEPFEPILSPDTFDGTSGFTIVGPQTQAIMGVRIAHAGDFNGDGIDDIAISASRQGARNEGAVYVVFGNPNGFPPTYDATMVDGTNGLLVRGVREEAFLGAQVTGDGDLNADGLSDLVIAEWHGHIFLPQDSRVFAVFGSADPLPSSITVEDLNGDNGFIVEGALAEQALGAAVDIAGDLNNDGVDDLVVSAINSCFPNMPCTGSVYILYGKTDGFERVVDISKPDGVNLARIDGFPVFMFGEFGPFVSTAGDLNNDSRADLAIADTDYDRVSIIYGLTEEFPPVSRIDDFDDEEVFVVSGPGVIGKPELVPDVNGDGIDDLLIGATSFNDVHGSAAVIFGQTGTSDDGGQNLLDGERGFRLLGFRPESWTGEHIGSIGDINSDGVQDFIIAAPRAAVNDLENAGEAYIIFGRHKPCPADLTGSSDPSDPTYGVRDGDADADDFFFLLDAFANAELDTCDLDHDNDCDADDFAAYLDIFSAGCQ